MIIGVSDKKRMITVTIMDHLATWGGGGSGLFCKYFTLASASVSMACRVARTIISTGTPHTCENGHIHSIECPVDI